MATLSRAGAIFGRVTFGFLVLVIASCGGGDSPNSRAAGPVALLAQSAPLVSPKGTLSIQVLSNRADMVSGGDALVQIVSSAGAYESVARIDLNGADITSAFALRADGRFTGLVTGLVDEPNLLRARLSDGTGARIGKVLGKGLAVVSSSLDVTGNNCNLVTQAETLMMVKEHLIETYGVVRYTFSVGGSGASIMQQWIANAYPGIFDGLIVEASFPDAWTEMMNSEDCISLVDYWTTPTRWGAGVVWGPTDQTAVENGDVSSSCVAFVAAFRSLFTPADETGQVPAATVYDAQANPSGVRGTLWDYSVSQLGRRPASSWGPVEQALGYGFPNRPIDTVGIQYGLKALLNAQITPQQFVDMNARVGGHDIDYNLQPGRTTADPAALSTVYRSGYINQANNLHVPIIDIRGTSNADLHDTFHSWSMRMRLDRANGNHDNQIIWDSFTASGFVVDTTLEAQAVSTAGY